MSYGKERVTHCIPINVYLTEREKKEFDQRFGGLNKKEGVMSLSIVRDQYERSLTYELAWLFKIYGPNIPMGTDLGVKPNL